MVRTEPGEILTQETFILAFHALQELQILVPIQHWLFKICQPSSPSTTSAKRTLERFSLDEAPGRSQEEWTGPGIALADG